MLQRIQNPENEALNIVLLINKTLENRLKTRMWANAQCDGCPAEHTWRPLFDAAKFG